MINYIEGDLLDIKKGIIIHQVNNKHVMASGIAKQIKAKYPQHFRDYISSDLGIGNLVLTRINPKFGIIGMVSQDSYGRDKRYTDYNAFRLCLLRIQVLHRMNPNVEYYMPYNIGCGLGGGDWNKILLMIDEVCPFMNIVKL